MSEHKEPIPSMIYNAAVGGHVTTSQQIIDENLNREQQDINEEVAGVPYNATTPNGMGKIVLKKNDNFKQVVEAQTDGNTIFVIKYDFTLSDNVTVPINCVLKFDGGSLSGAYTITGDNTGIDAGITKIFNTNVLFAGSFISTFVYPNWFGAVGDGLTDDSSAFNTALLLLYRMIVGTKAIAHQVDSKPIMIIPRGHYIVNDVTIYNPSIYIIGNGAILEASDGHSIFIATGAGVRKSIFNNIIFKGGSYHLNFNLDNIEATEIKIENCGFYIASNTSCYISTQSANVMFDNCHFYKNHINYNGGSDGVYFTNCWFNAIDSTANEECLFYVGGFMTKFERCFFIPSGYSESFTDIGYIDFTGRSLIIDSCRISNEPGLRTLVNYRSLPSAETDVTNGVIILNSHTNGGPLIRLFTFPRSITIMDCHSSANSDNFISFASSVNPVTLYSELCNIMNNGDLRIFDKCKITLIGNKTRTVGRTGINSILMPFVFSDKPIYIYNDNDDNTIQIDLYNSRKANYQTFFSDFVIYVEGVLSRNPAYTRLVRFAANISFDNNANTIVPVVSKQFGDDVSFDVLLDDSATISFDSSAATLHTLKIICKNDNVTYTSQLLMKYTYRLNH